MNPSFLSRRTHHGQSYHDLSEGAQRDDHRPDTQLVELVRSRLTPYMFIAPNLLLFSVFVFFPLLYAAYISVHQWSLIDTPDFVGVRNYTRLVSDRQFWQSLTNTVIYSAATVPTSLIIGLFLAIGLNRKLAARTLLRSIYFLPVVVSSVATAVIAAWLFNDNYGIINALLKRRASGPWPGCRPRAGRCRRSS